MDGKKIRKGGLIAVDQSGKVFPVTTIIANDEKIDGALIKIDAKPNPLLSMTRSTPAMPLSA